MMNYLNSWGLWINLGYFEAYCWIFNFITIIKIHLCFITEHYYKLMEIFSFLDNLDQQKIQSSQNWRMTGSTFIKSEEYHCLKINVTVKGQRVVWNGLYYSYINCLIFFFFKYTHWKIGNIFLVCCTWNIYFRILSFTLSQKMTG